LLYAVLIPYWYTNTKEVPQHTAIIYHHQYHDSTAIKQKTHL